MSHLKVTCSKTIKCASTFSFRTKFSEFPISPSMAARPACLNLLHLVRLSAIRTVQYKYCSSSTSNNLPIRTTYIHEQKFSTWSERLNFIPTWNMQNCIVGFNLHLYLCVCVFKKRKTPEILYRLFDPRQHSGQFMYHLILEWQWKYFKMNSVMSCSWFNINKTYKQEI
jgi:hypothetical protein